MLKPVPGSPVFLPAHAATAVDGVLPRAGAEETLCFDDDLHFTWLSARSADRHLGTAAALRLHYACSREEHDAEQSGASEDRLRSRSVDGSMLPARPLGELRFAP